MSSFDINILPNAEDVKSRLDAGHKQAQRQLAKYTNNTEEFDKAKQLYADGNDARTRVLSEALGEDIDPEEVLRLTTLVNISNRRCAWCNQMEVFPNADGSGSVPMLKCVKCQGTFYCSRKCQKKHWPVHKQKCNAVR